MSNSCTKQIFKSIGGSSYRGSYLPCGKPVKDEGLCGLHLAAKRRSEATDRRYRERAENRRLLHHKAACFDQLLEALKRIVEAHDKRGSVGYGLIEAGAIAIAKAEERS